MSKFYVKVTRTGTVVQDLWLTIDDATDELNAWGRAKAMIEADPEGFSWNIGATDFDNYEYREEKADD